MFLPGAMAALGHLYEAGYDVYVISNQQGVGLGLTTLAELERITGAIREAALKHGADIKKFYYATFAQDEDPSWRKPGSGMLLAAAAEFGLDLSGAFFIGDKWSDAECATRAGCKFLLVLSGVTAPGEHEGWEHKPERVFRDLARAADWVVARGKRRKS